MLISGVLLGEVLIIPKPFQKDGLDILLFALKMTTYSPRASTSDFMEGSSEGAKNDSILGVLILLCK